MKNAHRLTCLKFVLSSTLALTSTLSLAEIATVPTPVESKWNTATEEDLGNEINKIGEEIRVKVDASNDTKKKLEFVWTDPRYTSEAVEAKRKALKEAEDALIKAQVELRTEVSKLPEVQKLIEDNETLQANINSLRLKNTTLVELLRSRKRGKVINN